MSVYRDLYEHKDVTNIVDYGNNDDEYLPILKCVCGETFKLWTCSISYDIDSMPCCGRILRFENRIRVYELTEKEKK